MCTDWQACPHCHDCLCDEGKTSTGPLRLGEVFLRGPAAGRGSQARDDDEANEEATHKAFCDEELSKSRASQKDKTMKLDKTSARIDSARTTIAELEDAVKGLEGVFVVDSSAVRVLPPVNPQAAIMTFAHYVAETQSPSKEEVSSE